MQKNQLLAKERNVKILRPLTYRIYPVKQFTIIRAEFDG